MSDYVPESMAVPKPRNIAVSTAGPPAESAIQSPTLHREEYLGIQRGIARIPTDPFPEVPASQGLGITHEDEPASKRRSLYSSKYHDWKPTFIRVHSLVGSRYLQ